MSKKNISRYEQKIEGGRRFKEARVYCGYTTLQVSQALGYQSVCNVINIEAGRQSVPQVKMKEICKLFGVTKRYFSSKKYTPLSATRSE